MSPSTVLGPCTDQSGRLVNADRILRCLRFGANIDAICSPPSALGGEWMRVNAMPKSEQDAVLPFEHVAATLAGAPNKFDVVVRRAGAEILLEVGAPTSADLARVRSIMAPACSLVAAPRPVLSRPVVVGLTHRLQPEAGRSDSGSTRHQRLLDRLWTMDGDWSVFMRFRTVDEAEVSETRNLIDHLAETAAEQLSTTKQVSANSSATTTSHRWSRIQRWAEAISSHLAQGDAVGKWSVDTWVTSSNEACAGQLLGSLHGAVAEDQGRWFVGTDLDIAEGAPLPTSILTSRDIGTLLAPPVASQPGLAIRRSPPAGRRPLGGDCPVDLGTYWGSDVRATIGLDDLEGHGFVTGTTGAGKTTTLHRLLAELWNVHRVPFLVLDPVKDEYSAVASSFRGGLQVVKGNELHLNLLEAWPGELPRNHVSQVAQAFRGAFTMPSPTPYVVTQLFDSLSMLPGGSEGTVLHDVRDLVDPLVQSLGYAPEAQANIRASLLTRLNILLAPARAHRFAWPNSAMVEGLFTRPTVVTLADLVDDEERAFLVLVLALATWARARARADPQSVEHVLVLEEAHRIIPEVPTESADSETGSARQVSATLLSAMLAEVRGYGEQVIVVDQSPSRVSSEVVRNTNFKLVHRLVHPADRDEVAGTLGLEEGSAALLGELERGQAVLSTRREPAPQTLRIDKATPLRNSRAGAVRVAPSPADWPCCDGVPERHFRAWQEAQNAGETMALFLAGARHGDGDGRLLRSQVYESLARVSGGRPDTIPCRAWVGMRRLLTRERALGTSPATGGTEVVLRALFLMWDEKAPVNRDTADDFGVPGLVTFRVCSSCGYPCGNRVAAEALLLCEPRDGLAVLGTGDWRSHLPEVITYVTSTHQKLQKTLGTGAEVLVRCLVHQAVTRSRLSSDVAGLICRRSGMS